VGEGSPSGELMGSLAPHFGQNGIFVSTIGFPHSGQNFAISIYPPNCEKPEGTSVEDSAIVDNWVVELHPARNIERIKRDASVKIIFFLISRPNILHKD